MAFDPKRTPGRYLLSSAVLSSPGQYYFRKLTVEQAQEWLARGPVESGIGYQTTADAFESLFGMKPKVQRSQFWFEINDEGLVFRLKFRPQDTEEKFSTKFILRNCEIALLVREA